MNLKRIAEISPLIIGFLIFLGFFKLNWYYSHWNINISQYLDFSEILLSFLQDINIMLFFIVILAVHSIFGYIAISSVDHKTGIVGQLEDSFEQNKRGGLIALLAFTLVFGILFWWLMNLIWLYFTFLFFVQLIAFFIDRFISTNENVVNPVSLTIVFFAFTLCLSQYGIYRTETSNVRYKLTTIDNTEISTNRQLIFLGKTNNFIFLFDKTSCTSRVLKTESISSIQIK